MTRPGQCARQAPGRLSCLDLQRVQNAQHTWAKAMVFPVVMYECEKWTIKKAECPKMMLLNCGVGEDS